MVLKNTTAMKSKALHYLHTHTPVMVRTFPKSGFIILTVDSPISRKAPVPFTEASRAMYLSYSSLLHHFTEFEV